MLDCLLREAKKSKEVMEEEEEEGRWLDSTRKEGEKRTGADLEGLDAMVRSYRWVSEEMKS